MLHCTCTDRNTSHRPGIDLVSVKGRRATRAEFGCSDKAGDRFPINSEGLTKDDDSPDLLVDHQIAVSMKKVRQAYQDWTQTQYLMRDRASRRFVAAPYFRP